MAKHIHIHVHDAWEENKHPRAKNGEFGRGGNEQLSSHKEATPPPFINEFYKEHKSIGAMKQALAGRSKEHLQKALSLVKNHNDQYTNTVRRLIEKELDDRANRGL